MKTSTNEKCCTKFNLIKERITSKNTFQSLKSNRKTKWLKATSPETTEFAAGAFLGADIEQMREKNMKGKSSVIKVES